MKKSVAKVIAQLAMSNIELQDQIEVMQNRVLGAVETPAPEVPPVADPRDDPERGAAATIQRYMDLTERWRTLCVEVQRGAHQVQKLADGWGEPERADTHEGQSLLAVLDVIKRLATDMQSVNFKFDPQSYKEEE